MNTRSHASDRIDYIIQQTKGVNMDIESVKDRIRKLLNVAQNDASTEGEIDNALRAAKAMMDKQHLTEEDLREAPEDQYRRAEMASKDRYFATVGSKLYGWEGMLANFVSRFVGVGVYGDRSCRPAKYPNGILHAPIRGEARRGASYCFYGIAEDASIAVEIYYELWMSIRTMAQLKWGGACKGDGGMYCQGFVSGLKDRYEEEKTQERLTQSSNTTALVLIDRRNDLIERKLEIGKTWLENKCGVHLRRQVKRGASGSSNAFHEGKQDGRRTDVRAASRPKLS